MNCWPPKPGLTDISSTRSSLSSVWSRCVSGVAGLNTSPALQPHSLISAIVRSTCSEASGWKLMMLAPALANSGMMRSTGLTIRCTSIGSFVRGRSDAQTSGPMRQVRHVVVVHDVEMQQVGARRLHRGHFLAQAREVRREDRRGDAERGALGAGHGAAILSRVVSYNARMAQEKRYEIIVSPTVQYLPEQSDEKAGRYVFAYTITIRNTGNATAQLISRHWIITDAQGLVQEVRGLGVVGAQPVLRPGEQPRILERHRDRHPGGHDARQLPDGGRGRHPLRGGDSRSSRSRCRASCTSARAMAQWSMTPVIDWLLHKGRHLADAARRWSGNSAHGCAPPACRSTASRSFSGPCIRSTSASRCTGTARRSRVRPGNHDFVRNRGVPQQPRGAHHARASASSGAASSGRTAQLDFPVLQELRDAGHDRLRDRRGGVQRRQPQFGQPRDAPPGRLHRPRHRRGRSGCCIRSRW